MRVVLDLPEEDIARRWTHRLSARGSPVVRLLDNAPEDDELVTDEDDVALREAYAELDGGSNISRRVSPPLRVSGGGWRRELAPRDQNDLRRIRPRGDVYDRRPPFGVAMGERHRRRSLRWRAFSGCSVARLMRARAPAAER